MDATHTLVERDIGESQPGGGHICMSDPYMYERDREREQQQMDSMAAIPSSIFPPARRDVFSCLFPSFLLLYLFFTQPVRNNRQSAESGIAKKRERGAA